MSNASVARFEEVQYGIGKENAVWVLFCTFIILTMQTGFALRESGVAARKNVVNIMFKMVSDVVVAGLIVWVIGYGIAFGDEQGVNIFCGWGQWGLLNLKTGTTGKIYTVFTFQVAFASTASTIVSGATAERIKLHSYLCMTLCHVLWYSFAVHWLVSEHGWLKTLGAIDISGAGVVHVTGGATALAMACMLGPRKGRYARDTKPPVSNGCSIVLGLLYLWWGFLGFNCGSVFFLGANAWQMVGLTAVNTIICSLAGGLSGIVCSLAHSHGKVLDIVAASNGIIGALVAISVSCVMVYPWEAFIIGVVAGLIANYGCTLLNKIQVDDPVAAAPIHLGCGIWGMICVALFAKDLYNSPYVTSNGVFYGGSVHILGVQLLAAFVLGAWSLTMSVFVCTILRLSPLGLRLTGDQEDAGNDVCAHSIGEGTVEVFQGLSPGERFDLEHKGSYALVTYIKRSLHQDYSRYEGLISDHLGTRSMTVYLSPKNLVTIAHSHGHLSQKSPVDVNSAPAVILYRTVGVQTRERSTQHSSLLQRFGLEQGMTLQRSRVSSFNA